MGRTPRTSIRRGDAQLFNLLVKRVAVDPQKIGTARLHAIMAIQRAGDELPLDLTDDQVVNFALAHRVLIDRLLRELAAQRFDRLGPALVPALLSEHAPR